MQLLYSYDWDVAYISSSIKMELTVLYCLEMKNLKTKPLAHNNSTFPKTILRGLRVCIMASV
jgi:hypothetical protein